MGASLAITPLGHLVRRVRQRLPTNAIAENSNDLLTLFFVVFNGLPVVALIFCSRVFQNCIDVDGRGGILPVLSIHTGLDGLESEKVCYNVNDLSLWVAIVLKL